MNHENIVRVVDIVCSLKYLYIVTECMEMDALEYRNAHGAITDQVKLKEFTAHCYRGLWACHGRGIMHRNMKTANILINCVTLHAKLVDFRLARKRCLDPERTYTLEVMTLNYRAPEVILGQAAYNESVDVWSMGCVIAEMATNSALFASDDSVVRKCLNGEGYDDQTRMLMEFFSYVGVATEEVWPGVKKLPHYSKAERAGAGLKSAYPTFPSTWWSNKLKKSLSSRAPALGEAGAEFVNQSMRLCPQLRLSAKQACRHPFLAAAQDF